MSIVQQSNFCKLKLSSAKFRRKKKKRREHYLGIHFLRRVLGRTFQTFFCLYFSVAGIGDLIRDSGCNKRPSAANKAAIIIKLHRSFSGILIRASVNPILFTESIVPILPARESEDANRIDRLSLSLSLSRGG